MKNKSIKCFSILLSCCLIVISLTNMPFIVKATAEDAYLPLEIKSGFNEDVIVEASPAITHSTAPFDGYGDNDNHTFFSKSYNENGGIPNDGKLTSVSNPSVDYQLAPYDKNNALRLEGKKGGISKGTLELATISSYSSISVLGASASGAAKILVKINYTDGTSTNQEFKSKDWYFMDGYVIDGFKRVKRTDDSINGGSDGPRLYQYSVSTDAKKLVKSVEFQQSFLTKEEDNNECTVDGSGSRENGDTTTVLLAISGVYAENAPDSPIANPATNVKLSGFTASWNAVSGATGYVIDVATDTNFTQMIEPYNNKSVSGTSLDIIELTANLKYYYRVRATNELAQSKNSNCIEVITSCSHKLTHIEAKAATHTEAGNIEYWKCDSCNMYFSDMNAKTEIPESSIIIPAIGHELTHVDAKAATYTETGNIEHWKCESCDKYFLDAQGKTETTKEAIVIQRLVKEADTIKPSVATGDTTLFIGYVGLIGSSSYIGVCMMKKKKRIIE